MIIKAQKVTKDIKNEAGEDILARFCYFYPYTYEEAKRMPYRRILKMLKVARKEQAYEWYNLLRIAVAPQSKKGAVSDLIKEYKQIIETI